MFPLELFVPLCAELIQMILSWISYTNLQAKHSVEPKLFLFPSLLSLVTFFTFWSFPYLFFFLLFYPLLCLSCFFLVYLFLFSILSLSAVSFLICFSFILFPLMLFFCFCCWFFLLFCLLLCSPFLFLSLFPLFFPPLYLVFSVPVFSSPLPWCFLHFSNCLTRLFSLVSPSITSLDLLLAFSHHITSSPVVFDIVFFFCLVFCPLLSYFLPVFSFFFIPCFLSSHFFPSFSFLFAYFLVFSPHSVPCSSFLNGFYLLFFSCFIYCHIIPLFLLFHLLAIHLDHSDVFFLCLFCLKLT